MSSSLKPTSNPIAYVDTATGQEVAARFDTMDYRRPTGTLRLRITDAATKGPIVARLSLKEVGGKFHAPRGSLYRSLRGTSHFYAEHDAGHGLERRGHLRDQLLLGRKAGGLIQEAAIADLRDLLLRAALYFFSRNLSDFENNDEDEILQRAERRVNGAMATISTAPEAAMATSACRIRRVRQAVQSTHNTMTAIPGSTDCRNRVAAARPRPNVKPFLKEGVSARAMARSSAQSKAVMKNVSVIRVAA